MNTDDILKKINSAGGSSAVKNADSVLDIAAPPKEARALLASLKEAGFSHLSFITAQDMIKENIIELVYRLYSHESAVDASVKVRLPRAKPVTATISDIFRTADWHERETAEMFGVEFTGHPCPKGLLLPEGVKMPLRKDFSHPDLVAMPEA